MSQDFTRRTKSAWGEGAALKEEILDAAERLLDHSERESDLSLRAVAREVGISAPSIYLHFADRTELVDKVTERAYRQVAAEMHAARLACDDPREGLRAMARRYCAAVVRNRGSQLLMLRLERVATPVPRDHVVEVILSEWREAILAAGPDLDEVKAKRAATMIWVALHGLASLSHSFPGEEEDEIAAMADELVTQLTSTRS